MQPRFQTKSKQMLCLQHGFKGYRNKTCPRVDSSVRKQTDGFEKWARGGRRFKKRPMRSKTGADWRQAALQNCPALDAGSVLRTSKSPHTEVIQTYLDAFSSIY